MNTNPFEVSSYDASCKTFADNKAMAPRLNEVLYTIRMHEKKLQRSMDWLAHKLRLMVTNEY